VDSLGRMNHALAYVVAESLPRERALLGVIKGMPCTLARGLYYPPYSPYVTVASLLASLDDYDVAVPLRVDRLGALFIPAGTTDTKRRCVTYFCHVL